MGSKSNKGTQVAILLIAVTLFVMVFGQQFGLTGSKETVQATETIVQQASNDNFCANNPALDASVRIEDVLATTKDYVNGTVYIQNLDTGSVTTGSITGGSSSAFTTLSDVFDCKSVKGYKMFVQQSSTINSDGVIEITPAMLIRTPIEITIKASQYTPFKVKAYDNVAHSNAYDSSNSTDYVSASLTSTFYYSTGSTGWANNTDAMDVTLTLAPNVTGYAKGGSGMIIALDTEDSSHLSDFDEDLTQVWYNGVALNEATDLSLNELRALNTYEKIYKIADSVGKNAKGQKVTMSELRVRLEPESSATQKTFDPVIKIVALGDYASNKGDEVLTGVGFQDDASRTELESAQTITLSVID